MSGHNTPSRWVRAGGRVTLFGVGLLVAFALLAAGANRLEAQAQTQTQTQTQTQNQANPDAARSAPIATGARLAGDARRTRFVMDLTHAVAFNVAVLAEPFRVIIDTPEINFQLEPGLGRAGRGLVQAYRFGSFAKNRARIVLDTNSPVLIEKSFSLKAANGQPARLVIDLIRTTAQVFAEKQARARPPEGLPKYQPVPLPRARPPALEAPPANTRTPRPPKIALKPRAKPAPAARPVIVIDPGHGGVDPGAIGENGTTEKTVVFAFALALRDALTKLGRYEVVMTRTRDTFMRLRERVNVARRKKAQLFIAVHADSLKVGEARGATVYTLSERASDREAAALAHKENRADIIAGVDLGEESTEVTGILIDLAQRETKNLSILFAKRLIKELKKSVRLSVRPHRSAGFRVLKAPDVPSILLEIGYLSSSSDERLMRSARWRKKAARAVARAADLFLHARVARGN